MTLLEKDRLGVLDLVGTVIQDVYSLKFYIVRTTGIFTYPNGTVALPKEAFNNSRFFPVGNIIAYSEDAERKSYFTPKQLKRIKRKKKEAHARFMRSQMKMRLHSYKNMKFIMNEEHATLSHLVYGKNGGGSIDLSGFTVSARTG